jgi:hypothetical protein
MDAFQKMMQSQAKKQKVDVEPIYIAVIYIRWLRWIDPSEPLYNAPYVGQSVRDKDTPEKVAEERWKAENNQAVREDKDVGLIACLDTYGPDAFYDEVVESRRGPRSEVQKWANEREIALIAEYGGPLRNPSKKLHQTLNLTKGGKGNVNFEARDAARTISWLKFKREINAYVECNGTSLVPQRYVNPASGYMLGHALLSVRAGMLWRGHPDAKGRCDWLALLPDWAWNVYKTDKWKEEMSERSKEQARRESEANPGYRSRRAKEQAKREATAGKPSLGERGKATQVQNWSIEKAIEVNAIRWDSDHRINARANAKAQSRREEEANPGYRSRRAKEQAECEAKAGKLSLGERGKATQIQNWSDEKRQEMLKKRLETKHQNIAKLKALKMLGGFGSVHLTMGQKMISKAESMGVSFFQDASGEWHARMGKECAGSSAEHARAGTSSNEA